MTTSVMRPTAAWACRAASGRALELVFDLGVYYRNPNGEAEDAAAAGPEAEANSESTEEELRLLGLYPIIGLSATYRF